jgi:predicted dinucleotide-binding enzyme
MKIAVLGAKIIGSTLARKWAQAGHDVMFGVRTVDNPETQALAQELGATVGAVGDAVAFGEVIVFAIPGQAMSETIQAHAAALQGKIVIDAANRMGGGTMNSAAEFAAHAPGAQVYRAFNSLGWENFENPMFGDLQADLFYCGPAGAGQAAVERLIRDVGLRPVRVGDISQVGLVDTIGSLWFALAFGQGMGRHLAFKVLTRQAQE